MKKIIYIILLINLVFSQEEVMLDKISSVVENKIVLLSDVVLAANAISVQQNINPSNNPEEFLKILEQTRESMVEQLIIIEMAKKDSIEVLEKDIDRALDQQIENIISQSGGKEQAEEALGKKISTFKRSYRDDMKGKLLAEKYTSQLTSDISVSRKDVEEFYNNFKCNSIEDYLYYTLFTFSQLNINNEKIHVACTGEISLSSKKYEFLYKYVRNIEIIN